MIQFLSKDPIPANDYDIIFNHPLEISNHIRQLSEINIPFDTFLLFKESNQVKKEKAFAFFIQANNTDFLTDQLNPIELGDTVQNYLKNKAFRIANGEQEDSKDYLQFIYELETIRYLFFAPIQSIEHFRYRQEYIPVIRFSYPKLIKKHDFRNENRLNLTNSNPVSIKLSDNLELRLINISCGGIATQNTADTHFLIGDFMNFTLVLPNFSEQLLLKGEIRYLSATRIGIKFHPFQVTRMEQLLFRKKILIIRKFIQEEAKRLILSPPRSSLQATHSPKSAKLRELIAEQSSSQETIRPHYYELNKPFILLIDNKPDHRYNVLKLKYQLIKSLYTRVETLLRLHTIHLILFNPDFTNFRAIIRLLKSNPMYHFIPKILLTQQFTRDFIISMQNELSYHKILKFPFHTTQLLHSIDNGLNCFKLSHEMELTSFPAHLQNLKYLFVSNSPSIIYGLSLLFYELKLDRFYSELNGNKLISAMNQTDPDILILDNYLNDINSLRLCPIIKRNPRFKKIKIILMITHPLADYLEKISHYQIDRYIFYPFQGEDILDIIQSLDFEM